MTSATKVWKAARIVPLSSLVLCVVIVPLGLLVSYSFRESSFLGVGPGPTLDQYRMVFASPETVRVMLRTLCVALVVATLVTAVSFVAAYAIRFRLHGRTANGVLGVVVASGVASFLVRIYAWGSILGTDGLINGALERLGIIDEPLGYLYFGYFAVALTMTYLYLPFAVLIVFTAMQGIDPGGVEASRDLGAGRWRTAAQVVAPQAKTGIVSAFVLTAISASADYVTPQLVGGPRGLMVGAMVKDLALRGGDLPGAAALELSFLLLFIATFAVMFIAGRMFRLGRRLGKNVATMPFNARLHTPLGRISLSKALTAIVVVYLVVPTLLVVLFSFSASPTTGLPIEGLTTHWYGTIVERSGFVDSLQGSATVTTFAVLVATAIAVPASFALAQSGGWGKRALLVLVLVPVFIPGVLLGSSLLVATRATGIGLGLAATAVVHVVLLVSQLVLIVYTRLIGIDPNLRDAARDLGASPWRTLRAVTLPLLLPAVIGGALLAAADSLDEIFVSPFTLGTANTLPVWLLSQARTGFSPGINAVGVMLLCGTLSAFTLAVAVGKSSIVPNPDKAESRDE